jgi:hypothetical protein
MDFVDRYKELGMYRNFYFSALAETITEQCNAFSLSVGAGLLIKIKTLKKERGPLPCWYLRVSIPCSAGPLYYLQAS